MLDYTVHYLCMLVARFLLGEEGSRQYAWKSPASVPDLFNIGSWVPSMKYWQIFNLVVMKVDRQITNFFGFSAKFSGYTVHSL